MVDGIRLVEPLLAAGYDFSVLGPVPAWANPSVPRSERGELFDRDESPLAELVREIGYAFVMTDVAGMVAGIKAAVRPRAAYLEPVMRLTMVSEARLSAVKNSARISDPGTDPLVKAGLTELVRVTGAAVDVGEAHLDASRLRMRKAMSNDDVVRRFASVGLPARGVVPGLAPHQVTKLRSRWGIDARNGRRTTRSDLPPGLPLIASMAAVDAWDDELDDVAAGAAHGPWHVLAHAETHLASQVAWTQQGTPTARMALRNLALAWWPGQHAYDTGHDLYLAPVPEVVAKALSEPTYSGRLVWDLGQVCGDPKDGHGLTANELDGMCRLRTQTGPLSHWGTALATYREMVTPAH